MGLTKPRASQIYDIDYKQSTRVVTITNITLAGGAPNAVDGVNLSLKDRVLVTGQSSASQNGIYQVSTLGTGSNGTWVRTSDTNETGEIDAGTIVMVTEGNVYADTQWKLITNDPIVIGVTGLTFVQNYLANSISAGTSNVVVNSNAAVTISSAGTANVVSIANTSVTFAGNLFPTANITYSLGNTSLRWKDLWLSNSTLYIGNTSIATVGSTLTVNGANVLTGNAGASFSTTGDVLGKEIWSTNSVGDEGGQLNLANPAANSTIAGNSVSVDIYQNRFRIFEQGGNSRGAFIDLTLCSAGVGTNLLAGGGGGGSPGGSNAQIQFNDASTFGGSAAFTFNKVSNAIVASGNITSANLFTGGSVSAAGNITCGNIINNNANGVGNIGSATTYFNTVFAKATSAQYADLAEMYVADAEYAPGTVVEFGGENEITISSCSHSTRVAGIISTNPSYLMNATQTGNSVLPVALTGRVPCHVIGIINKGDRLVASDIPGVAQALDLTQYQPACIIGKALENYNQDNPGVIEVAVGRT